MPRTEPARGMRDFLPEDVRRREYVIGIIKRVYERYGFEPLETPAVENLETLLGKYGDEGNQLIFKILKRGEHEASGAGRPGAALRPDGAAGARRRAAPGEAAAALQALPDPAGLARRSSGARTLPRVLPVRRRRARLDVAGRRGGALRGGGRRADRARVQRLRHPAQSSPAARRRCSRRPAFQRIAHGAALVALDKLDKIGADGVVKELAERGVDDASRTALLSMFHTTGADGVDWTASTGSSATSRAARAAVENLRADLALLPGTRRCRRRFASIRAWRAGSRTTRARSWRSTSPTWPAASAAAAATTTWSACSSGRTSRPAAFRSASSGSWS